MSLARSHTPKGCGETEKESSGPRQGCANGQRHPLGLHRESTGANGDSRTSDHVTLLMATVIPTSGRRRTASRFGAVLALAERRFPRARQLLQLRLQMRHAPTAEERSTIDRILKRIDEAEAKGIGPDPWLRDGSRCAIHLLWPDTPRIHSTRSLRNSPKSSLIVSPPWYREARQATALLLVAVADVD